jgi:RecB family endonuclease NucS
MNSENESVHTTSLLYEKEVQDYLGANLDLLGIAGLKLVQFEHPVQFGRDVGRIDILATDAHCSFVVIEVKRGVAGRGAIGQLQSYMGAIADAHSESKVRGILVAMGIDDAASAAMRMTQNIEYFEFQTRFVFKRVSTATPKTLKEASVRLDYWEKLGGTILTETMTCNKCHSVAKVVLVGNQRVCGLCGAPKR